MSDPERGPADTQPLLPAPEPVDIGLIIALPIEAGTIRDALEHPREYRDPERRHKPIIEGDLLGRRVALVVSGPGQASARVALNRLLAGHHPRWILSVGFAGALDPELRLGDALLTREVVQADTGERLTIDFNLAPPTDQRPGRRLRAGRLVTVSQVARTSAEKAELRLRHEADMVDMETFAIASHCAERGERFLGIRVISDLAAQELPPEVLGLVGPTGGYRLGATMGALWKRPGSARDLWRLYEQAREAADRLAQVTCALLPHLP